MVADDSLAERGLSPGQVIAERYRIEHVLGKGGMGIVFAALHLHLRERVAIKVLLPEASHPDAVARFIREARAAAKIKNEHVVRVTDVGMFAEEQPYMIMELLEGEDLSSLLARRALLPVAEATEIVLQVCEAIAAAHALGVIHRDLKPSNLFLERRADGVPWVKVLDFGISKMLPSGLTEAEATLTRSIGLIGSPFYMSPEQVRAPRSVDARSDVWAIGVILYQLLSGRAPFTGQSVPELSVKIAVEAAPPLPPNLPAAVASVVYRCLEKEREARFQTVADLADALAPFAPERARTSAVRARELLGSAPRSSSPDVRFTERTPSSSGAPEAKTALTVSAWVQKAPPRRLGFVALAAAIGALTLAGLAWFERDGGAPPAPMRSGSPLAEGTRGVEDSPPAPMDSAHSQAPPGLSAAPSSSTAPPVAHSSGPTAGSAAAPASSGALRAGLASAGASGKSRPVTVRSPPPEPRSTPEPSASPVQQSPFDVRKW